MPRDSTRLRVFQLADRLVLDVYRVTATLPAGERYGRQLRRAAVSTATNLVEGAQRDTTREYRRFVSISMGSAAEVRYLLSVLHRLGLLDDHAEHLNSEYDGLVRALHNLHSALGRLS